MVDIIKKNAESTTDSLDNFLLGGNEPPKQLGDLIVCILKAAWSQDDHRGH